MVNSVAELRSKGLSYREIARVLGITVSAVRWRLKHPPREREYNPEAWSAWQPERFYGWVERLHIPEDLRDVLIEAYHRGEWVKRVKQGEKPETLFNRKLRFYRQHPQKWQRKEKVFTEIGMESV